MEGSTTLVLEEPSEATALQSRGEALSTFDLNGQPLTLSGAQGATFSGLLKDSGEGRLTLTGNQQNLDTAEGSSVSSVSVEGGVMTVGAKKKGVLKMNSLKVGSQGTFSLGTSGGGEEEASNEPVSGDLNVQNLSVDGTFNVNKTDSFVAETLTGTGDINLAEGTLMTLALQDDGGFEGTFSGTGTVAFTAEQPVTFALPQRASFAGTLEVGEQVTIVEPLLIAAGETYTLTENKKVAYLKSDPGTEATLNLQSHELTLEGGDDPTFYGNITHNDWRGNLALTGNKQNLDTAEGSGVNELTVTSGTLTIGANNNGSLMTDSKFIVEPEGAFVLGTENVAQGKLVTMNNAVINGQVKLLNGTMKVYDGSNTAPALEGKGTIFVGEQATLAFDLAPDWDEFTFDGSITGPGTVSIKAGSAFTFTWPQRALFEGTLDVGENVTILPPLSDSPEEPAHPLQQEVDFNGQILTLTGNDADEELLTKETLQLSESRTVRTLTSQANQSTYSGRLSDTGNTGTLTITGGSHVLNTAEESSVQNLSLTGGELTLGDGADGTLSVGGPLDIAENAILKVGGEEGTGKLTVAGTTTNNGRLEILNTGEGQSVSFARYQGNGTTYIARGASMSVTGEGGTTFVDFGGRFDGEGHLVLSEGYPYWRGMGGGTLGFLTIAEAKNTAWNTMSSPLTCLNGILIKSQFSLTDSEISCSDQVCQECSCLYLRDASTLTTKTYSLEGGEINLLGGSGCPHLIVQEDMSTASGSGICLGAWSYERQKLTVGGVLTHNGALRVNNLQQDCAITLGGLEGAGSIELYNSSDKYAHNMVINFKRDCAFTGTITNRLSSNAVITLHAETPVTFTWPQRALFTGTVNKDDTVTVVEG